MWRATASLQKASRELKHLSARPRPPLSSTSDKPDLLRIKSAIAYGTCSQVSGRICFPVVNLPGVSSRVAGLSLQLLSHLHASAALTASNIIQFPLAQTGEGIKECELTQWFVEV